MENEKLAILWEQYLSGNMSKPERTELRMLLEDPANQDFFGQLLNSSMEDTDIPFRADAKKEAHIRQLMGKLSPNTTPVVHRTHFLRRNWFRYAAAITLVLGVGTYFLLRPAPETGIAKENHDRLIQTIQPGKDRALLTLADGSTILLDSAGNGAIAQQGNTRIMKDADGKIVYGSDGSAGAGNMMNTMQTPRGGKYQLTLPDGTKVWLNAASSITFPVAFTAQERTVSITGEAYFEVASDKLRPFFVTGGRAHVQILGTQFNINAYDDESDLKVTLLSGTVKVEDLQSKETTLLAPGQQAQIGASLITSKTADISQVMAWKNDLFNFDDMGLADAMRQISRWYDIKVVYENGVPKTQLWGKMSRNTSFERMLRNLKDIGVNYRINERKELIILQ
ncbi:MAG: FecR domain-containing protein [Chitinophagaceae bacterium]|nr:FecR domain-containing protein [Chitinophagaceae bacterium]